MKFAALDVLKRASLFSLPSSRLLPGAIKTAEEPGSIVTDITCERLSPLPHHRFFFPGNCSKRVEKWARDGTPGQIPFHI